MVSRENGRIYRLFFLIGAVVALILLIRTIQIIASAKTSQQRQYENPVVSQQVVRGTIMDRNGKILAIETPYWACALHLTEVDDIEETLSILAPMLDLQADSLIEQAREKSTYLLVKRHLSDAEYKDIERLVLQHNLHGVVLEKRYGRVYPQQFHAAQTIGFTNVDNQGLEGAELAYDALLSPYPALQKEPTYGNDIMLTLDMDIQYLLDRQALAIDAMHHPDAIMGIVMDARTGEILALTTYPWFDPNHAGESSPQVRKNRVIDSMYEPGSVFKVFSLAAILEAGQADLTTPFYCDGTYTFTMQNGSQTMINCTKAHGEVVLDTMIAYSCNGAAAHWASQTDDASFYQTLADFGFGTAWDIGLPGVSSGLLNEISSWSGRTKATMAFGQEIAATALQIATAATALANKGNLLFPALLKKVSAQDGTPLDTFQPKVAKEQIICAEHASAILAAMEQATQPGGTATRTAVSGIRVASKTGTAQMVDLATGSYRTDRFLASTLSLVPADDPRYIIYLAVDNPTGSTIWGSNIAAPAIGSMITDLARQGKLISNDMESIRLF